MEGGGAGLTGDAWARVRPEGAGPVKSPREKRFGKEFVDQQECVERSPCANDLRSPCILFALSSANGAHGGRVRKSPRTPAAKSGGGREGHAGGGRRGSGDGGDGGEMVVVVVLEVGCWSWKVRASVRELG